MSESTVKRYEPVVKADPAIKGVTAGMTDSDHGSYVRYVDYDQLQQQNAELRAEVFAQEQLVSMHRALIDKHGLSGDLLEIIADGLNEITEEQPTTQGGRDG